MVSLSRIIEITFAPDKAQPLVEWIRATFAASPPAGTTRDAGDRDDFQKLLDLFTSFPANPTYRNMNEIIQILLSR